MKCYLAKTTGYSRVQLTRFYPPAPGDGEGGRPPGREPGPALRAAYTLADVRLMARVDEDLGRMSGLATRIVRGWNSTGSFASAKAATCPMVRIRSVCSVTIISR